MLVVHPDALEAAADRIRRAADAIHLAAEDFAAVVGRELPSVGQSAYPASAASAQAADDAANALATDLRHLAAAFAVLGRAYPQLDAGLVPSPHPR